MDQSDAKDLAELNQTLNQTLSHVDATSIANHAIYNGMLFWAVIGSLVFAAIYYRHKARIERTKLMQTLVEKGQPIPPELLAGDAKVKTSINPASIGVVLISIGLATMLFLCAMTSSYFGDKDPDKWLPFAGVFPLFIGIAFLGIGLHQRRHG